MRDTLLDVTRYEKEESNKALVFRKLIKMRVKYEVIRKAENLASKNLPLLIFIKNCEHVFYYGQIRTTMAYINNSVII